MSIRNRHRVGRYLMVDDESGIVIYDDEAVRIWDGTFRHKKMWETRQPQEFIKARKDPRALRHVRPDEAQPLPANSQLVLVGDQGTVETPTGPASHLFDPGIGDMEIELTFTVR